jgi:hypothetical protein
MFSRTFAAVIAAVLLSLGLGACTQKSSGPISKSNLSTLLQQNGVSKNFANCVRDQMYPKLTDAQKKAMNKNSPSKEDTAAIHDLAAQAGATCKAPPHNLKP